MPKKHKERPTTIMQTRIDREVVEGLKFLAARDDRSMARYVGRVLREHVRANLPKTAPENASDG